MIACYEKASANKPNEGGKPVHLPSSWNFPCGPASLEWFPELAYKFVTILVYAKVYSAVRASADLVFDNILVDSVLRAFCFIACIFRPCI